MGRNSSNCSSKDIELFPFWHTMWIIQMYSLLYGLYEVLNKKYSNYTSPVDLSFLYHHDDQPLGVTMCECHVYNVPDDTRHYESPLNTDLKIFSQTWKLHRKTLHCLHVNLELRHQKEASGIWDFKAWHWTLTLLMQGCIVWYPGTLPILQTCIMSIDFISLLCQSRDSVFSHLIAAQICSWVEQFFESHILLM